ncbi:hypothetical protein MRX96_029703 [Rhipicephalus microplus]
MQYVQQDAYGQQAPYGQGVYPPGGTYAAPQAAGQFADPSYAATPAAVPYGPQPYATDAYGQPVIPTPSNPALAPMYDPGYPNYMYGMPPPRSPRRYIIQVPPRRKATFNTDNLLTILIVCGTLFLVLIAMLIIITTVVPRFTRKQHSGHKARKHEFPNEFDNLADSDLALDAPQMSPGAKTEKTESKLNTSGADHGSKHGKKDPQMASHVKSRSKG